MSSFAETIEALSEVGRHLPLPQIQFPSTPIPRLQPPFQLTLLDSARLVPNLGADILERAEKMLQVPTRFYKDVGVDEWIRSLSYTETDTRDLVRKLLTEYELESSRSNEEWLTKTFDDLILSYEREYGLSLTESQRGMLSRMAMKIAYDRLSVASST